MIEPRMSASGEPQKVLSNVLLSAGVTALLIVGLEGVCRLTERLRPDPKVASYLWDWEERWDGEFYTMGPPGNGWPPWEEFNADGLRDRAHPVEKLEDVWRVAFLGDSVTMGAGIEPREAYPQVLESLLRAQGRGIEVFNVALWGWSTRQERIAYERLVRKYRPDLVVLAVCLNDIPELQNNLSRPPRWISALHRHSALVRRVVNASGREIQSVEQLFGARESSTVREAWARFFDEVRPLDAAVARDGTAFAVLVLPFRFQVRPGASPPAPQQAIEQFCRDKRLRCLDLLDALRRIGEEAFIDYDHLSAKGTRAVAEALLASRLLPEWPSYPATLREALGALQQPAAARAAAWAREPDAGDPTAAVPGLVEALAGPEARVRAAAAWGLMRMGPAARAALLPLMKALREDRNPAVRATAAQAVGALGTRVNRSAVAALFEALSDASQTVRWRATQALWKSHLKPPGDVPRLVERLQNTDDYVRGFAAWMLGNMGPAAKEAIPALMTALEKEDGPLRGEAALALAKMGAVAKQAVPELARALKSADHQRRRSAAKALGSIGPEAKGAVPFLIAALTDEDERVRAQAARALGRIGLAAPEAVPARTVATHDPKPVVRREAEEALRRIAPAHQSRPIEPSHPPRTE